MNSGAVIMFALMLTSLTLCVSLVVGWATLGRSPHALLWAAAFGAGAVQWGLMGQRAVNGSEALVGTLATSTLGITLTLLLLAGFKARAGDSLRTWVAVTIGVASSILAAALSIGDQPDLAKAVPHLMRTLLLPFAVATMSGCLRQRRYTDVFASGVLLVFALLSLTIGLLRLSGTSESGELAHLLGLVGLPVAFANVGAATLLRLASDLAVTLKRLAVTDPLTGLLNRRGLEDAVAALGPSMRSAAVLVLDVDGFKLVNDSRGHAAGDEVLTALASCLTRAVRAGDIAARLGGDEFALVLADAGAVEGEAMASRIRSLLENHPAREAGHPLPTVSIGIAGFSRDTSLRSALAEADRALYLAKRRDQARPEPSGGRLPKPISRKPLLEIRPAKRSRSIGWARAH